MIILKYKAYKIAAIRLIILACKAFQGMREANYIAPIKGVKSTQKIKQGGFARATFSQYENKTVVG